MKKTVSLLLALLTALSLNIWGALGAYANSVGDINGNGKIDMTDYILLKRAYFGTYDINKKYTCEPYDPNQGHDGWSDGWL